LNSNILPKANKAGLLAKAFVAALFLLASQIPLRAQLTSNELYNSFQNQLGVADTLTGKLLAQRAAGRANLDPQALEEPVDPRTYKLGPGDGVYLNVYAVHSLDQDLSVSPDGRLIIPNIGRVDVNGLTLVDAETKVREALGREYKAPVATLSLRRLRPIKVNVLGEVLSPGVQQATAMQRVSEVIDRSGGFKGTSSLRNIEIRSQTGAVRAHADLFRYFALGDLAANPVVEGGDLIVVPRSEHFIAVYGSVGQPQRIEFVEGDSLSTVIALSKGLLPNAISDSIEFSRFPLNDPTAASRMYVNYPQQNPKIVDGDQIFIRSLTTYHVQRSVSVGGQVQFPGRYAIDAGTTRLRDVLGRAGGVLPTGSLDEAILIRRVGIGSWENDPEYKRIVMIAPMRKEGMSEEEYTYLAARQDQFNRATMVVDFKALMNGDEAQNILVREEDSVYIPRAMGYVTVSGSVNRQGNVGYIEGGSFEDYIAKAGGFSGNADQSAVRVVNPKTGSYIDPRSDRHYQIAAGDMILVPQEHSTFWKNLETGTAITAQILTIFAGIFFFFKK
jgi:protein involved in polysaccharide export with SLBB domain